MQRAMIPRARAAAGGPVVPLAPSVGIAALALSVVTGIALVEQPALAAAPIAALVGALLLVDGRARLALVVFGGLFLLQRSAGLSASKIGLLAAFLIAFVGALFNVRKIRRTAPYQLARPLLSISIPFASIVVLSMFAAHLRGTPLSDTVRDATPYLLFASTPVFVLDAQSVLSRRALQRFLIAAGLLGAISFAVVWLQRRGLAYLPLSRVGVASVFVPAALFSFAMATALQASAKRLRWLLLAAALLALLVPTGTRTTLALFVAPFVIAIASRHGFATRAFRLAAVAPIAVALAFVFGLAVIEFTHANTTFLQKRITLLKSSGNSQSDASYNDRIKAAHAAWSAFRSNPVFGVGTGYSFEYIPQGSQVPTIGFQLDTPLTFLAKFGIIGLALLAFVANRFWSFLRMMGRVSPGIAYLALTGYVGVVVALSVFTPPFEDKGFSYGLILVLALALNSLRDSGRTRHAMNPG
jgi:hypothetical protein